MNYSIQKIFGSYSISIINDDTAKLYDGVQEDVIKIIKELEQENNQLKESLHQTSIGIQELIEQDIECHSSCHKLKELRSWLEEEINNIETLFGGETSMTIGYKTVLSKLNELEGGKNE